MNFQYISFIRYFHNLLKSNDFVRNKNAIEYVDGNKNGITYQQLDQISDYVASSLYNTSSPSKGIIVAVYLPHSFELIVSILSIWKLGYIYVPLDTSYPLDRLSYITQNSEATLILTSNDWISKIKPVETSSNSIKIIPIESLFNINGNSGEKWWNCFDKKPLHIIENLENDRAYLIYTSGSTGSPKGVLVSHRGIVNFLIDQIDAFEFSSSTRLLQSLPICFDASLSEIGTCLLSGGTLMIPKSPQESTLIRGSSQSFYQCILDNHITAVMVSPSFLSQLSIDDFVTMNTPLKTIVIGGEVCPVRVINQWIDKVNLVNVYGPTEATVCTTILRYQHQLSPDDVVYIGKPVSNTKVYLLDDTLNEITTIGNQGEIYIGGVGVAMEYYKLSESTKKSFIPSPFSSDDILFKTGDWGKLHNHSNIEFRGRMDNQVKLNGSRVELDEISRSLEQHPLVHQSIVDTKTLDNGQRLLVAYLILKSSNQVSCKLLPMETTKVDLTSELCQFLKSKLPNYMIPKYYIVMESFPLNSNEKVNRSLLPMPTVTNVLSSDSKSLKSILLSTIQNILQVPIKDEDDLVNSLSLTSIDSVRIIQSLRNQGILLSPIQLYTYKSVNMIINYIEQQNNQQTNNSIYYKKSIKELKEYLKFKNNNLQLKTNVDSTDGKCIIITGSSGNLGGDILHSMINSMEYKEYKFILPIRDIKKQSNDNNRVMYIKADLSLDNFGLSEIEWDGLRSKTKILIHCAAKVDMTLPLELLYNDNVKSIYNILSFITNNTSIKQFHYISTLSTVLSNSSNWLNKTNLQIVLNQSILNTNDDEGYIYGGYAQSKWLGEYVLLSGIDSLNKDIKVTVHRPGMIISNNRLDYLSRLLDTCKLLTRYPIIPDNVNTDITPISKFTEEFMGNIRMTSIGSRLNYYSYFTQSISLMNLFKQQTRLPEFLELSEWKHMVTENLPFNNFIDLMNNMEVFERVLFPGYLLSNN
ncbi:hypothetical protein DLAC_07582 [Tieghemostelium lacteum]|uniref:Carrier domain-containing protein n=1 Tax=Tieghemostelium lacteum TaxID=361077 RepID=A0A151ZCW3_TIELA|nr:hypothetical protein DLAC_07582 [Tieghemostelium lacteum]|eukprot:KYQ91787.1 hypothetical protein DLAC_07582 [Tieghemostelium lacteum]